MHACLEKGKRGFLVSMNFTLLGGRASMETLTVRLANASIRTPMKLKMTKLINPMGMRLARLRLLYGPGAGHFCSPNKSPFVSSSDQNRNGT